MTTGDRIRNRRLELGLTQEDLAKKMGLAGKSTISKIESSGNEVSLKQVRKYAEALNCTVGYLLGMDATPSGHKVHSLFTKEQRDAVDAEAMKAHMAAAHKGLMKELYPTPSVEEIIAQDTKRIMSKPDWNMTLNSKTSEDDEYEEPKHPSTSTSPLTKREQLIQSILQMTDDQVDDLFKYALFILSKTMGTY